MQTLFQRIVSESRLQNRRLKPMVPSSIRTSIQARTELQFKPKPSFGFKHQFKLRFELRFELRLEIRFEARFKGQGLETIPRLN